MQKNQPLTPELSPLNEFTAYVETREDSSVRCIKAHYHTSYELLYFIEGESHIHINNNVYRATAGDLAVYRPGMVHEEFIQPGLYRHICLRLPQEKVELPFPGEKELGPVIRLPWQDRFHHILEQIVLEKGGVDKWSEIMLGSFLMQFIILLWRALSYCKQFVEESSEEQMLRISRVIDLIYSRIDTEVSLKDLASNAFMSESHFSHTFKGVVGVSPKRYMITAKLEKARELLTMTAKSVAEISRMLGYETPHYFNRVFKKECNCTPIAYRNSNSRKSQ